MSAILSLKWLPKKPAGKPETAVFLLEKPETAGFPKSQDCPQPTHYARLSIRNCPHRTIDHPRGPRLCRLSVARRILVPVVVLVQGGGGRLSLEHGPRQFLVVRVRVGRPTGHRVVVAEPGREVGPPVGAAGGDVLDGAERGRGL